MARRVMDEGETVPRKMLTPAWEIPWDRRHPSSPRPSSPSLPPVRLQQLPRPILLLALLDLFPVQPLENLFRGPLRLGAGQYLQDPGNDVARVAEAEPLEH